MANITIAAMTSKATPVAGDLLEIADSAAANAAKNITVGSLPISTATQTALDAKQALDADLTTIAGLTATTDNVMQAKAGVWASRTLAQLIADLIAVGAWTEAVQDVVGALVVAAGGTYDDSGGTIALPSAVLGSASVAYGATVTPAPTPAAPLLKIGALTGNITIAAVASPVEGQKLFVRFLQDGTGGRTVTWNSQYATQVQPDTAASAATLIGLVYDSILSKWV